LLPLPVTRGGQDTVSPVPTRLTEPAHRVSPAALATTVPYGSLWFAAVGWFDACWRGGAGWIPAQNAWEDFACGWTVAVATRLPWTLAFTVAAVPRGFVDSAAAIAIHYRSLAFRTSSPFMPSTLPLSIRRYLLKLATLVGCGRLTGCAALLFLF